jgi:hypothetical protein
MGTSSTLDDRYFAEELAQSGSAAGIAAKSPVPPASVSFLLYSSHLDIKKYFVPF